MKNEEGFQSGKRRFLVLARVGEDSLHREWIADDTTPRNWDLQLNVYAKDHSLSFDGDLPTVFDYGTKWDSIARHFKANPELLDRYDYIMLPDDDLRMKSADISRLFDIAVEHDLTMAQPAMTHDSYVSHEIVLRVPGFRLRYSNFLESMSCCIKSSYLRTLLPMFERHFTGWGTDLIWTMLMEDPAFRAAIVDEVPMVHVRPLYSGPIYVSFTKDGIDPRQEVRLLTSCFDNYSRFKHVYGGWLTNGRRVGDFETRIRNAIALLRIAPRMQHPRRTVFKSFWLVVWAFTKAGYRPEQLRAIAGTEMALLGLGKRASVARGEADSVIDASATRDTVISGLEENSMATPPTFQSLNLPS
ncbi:fucolectin tachylectin-4 pentraxin-1 [Acetobacter aceti NRIC 0242]|uniref:DUF707 domain-containing protein n=1 Tax=Acetobacter aceti NBRC 14818 TaxID=887700 RepID=A0AB33IAG0_ACEAC|nr:DUF707 domain-containing protein [Acetobacter aceti]TCS35209.1 uncharacterized protein DUF707 [Acetobacter aceti NBRC 14818]BCK75405.1 hypothetical protein EMQ_1011 [Acetobacter aceti NBRC 14818]GAN57304.1 hypothetical protein Abac_017_005 [Acetobacter aceti NBRC 14818]GBO81410.1 fucolectin tachylectin-4 pentraxin-1 [Acetobacter aceti NRIC 0242]